MRLILTLEGDQALSRKIQPSRLLGSPSHTLMANIGAAARDDIRDETPVGVTGDLKASIDFQIDSASVSEWVRVGSNLDYATYVHEGTRPHWPPIAAITPWALMKGIPPGALAASIARKGTRANPFVKRGFAQTESRMGYLLNRMARDIETRFGRGA